MTATTHTLTIEAWRPTSLNVSLRKHHHARAASLRKLADLIAVEAYRQTIPKAAGRRRVSLRVTLSGRQKPLDGDNAWKQLLDALTRCGLLVDDSAAWCELGPVAFERGDATRTEITLEDMG